MTAVAAKRYAPVQKHLEFFRRCIQNIGNRHCFLVGEPDGFIILYETLANSIVPQCICSIHAACSSYLKRGKNASVLIKD